MSWDVVHGDGLQMLADQDTAIADCVITDPPYCAGGISESQRTRAAGQGLRSENIRRFGWFIGDNMGTAGLVWLLRAVAVQAARVVKPTGSLLVFCDWRMLPTLQPAIESAGLRYQSLVVWDKGNMGLGRGFRSQHELIMHFTMGEPEYHDLGTSNVLRCARVDADDREHQTQKPVELLDRLVGVASPPGGLVIDPFCGSGSTGVAARRTGRRFLGSDIDGEHVSTARRRIADAAPLWEEAVPDGA